MEEQRTYRAVQMDAEGGVVTEDNVVAANYASALRRLKTVESNTFRIVVYNQAGDRAGEATAAYWHNSVRR